MGPKGLIGGPTIHFAAAPRGAFQSKKGASWFASSPVHDARLRSSKRSGAKRVRLRLHRLPARPTRPADARRHAPARTRSARLAARRARPPATTSSLGGPRARDRRAAMTDLRTPHERRSDQLSVLVRRPLSAALCARFVRTTDSLAAAPAGFRFDDYDSDTETECGAPLDISPVTSDSLSSVAVATSTPAAGLSRDGSPSGSSVSAETALADHLAAVEGAAASPRAASPALASPPHASLERRTTPPVVYAVPEDMPFQRARARSFYGAAAADDDDEGGTALSSSDSDESDDDADSAFAGVFPGAQISESRLRRALAEDYALFAPQSATTRKRAITAPSLTRRNTSGSAPGLSTRHSHASIVRRLASAVNAPAAPRRSRSFSSLADARARAEELRTLVPDEKVKAVSENHVPLFVEEAGRDPRVAFVNGDLHRVRVRRSSVDGGGTRTPIRRRRSRFARSIIRRFVDSDKEPPAPPRDRRRSRRKRTSAARMSASTSRRTEKSGRVSLVDRRSRFSRLIHPRLSSRSPL